MGPAPPNRNQECLFGDLEPHHACYCDNPKLRQLKCHHWWSSGGERRDTECKFFEPNPAFDGDLERACRPTGEREE